MNDKTQPADALDTGNTLYGDYASRMTRNHQKMLILCKLIYRHGYTNIKVLAPALRLSRSRCQTNVKRWLADGVLREVRMPGIGRLLGFGPGGASFARAELNIPARTLHPTNLGKQGQKFAHALAAQQCVVDVSRLHDLRLENLDFTFEISYDDKHGDSQKTVDMQFDAAFSGALIEVQLSRISKKAMKNKIVRAVSIASAKDWQLYFYTGRDEIYNQVVSLIKDYNGYQDGAFHVSML